MRRVIFHEFNGLFRYNYDARDLKDIVYYSILNEDNNVSEVQVTVLADYFESKVT